MRLHLAQLEAASQVSQVWLILVVVLTELIENPNGQTRQVLPVLQVVSATHDPLVIVYPCTHEMQLLGFSMLQVAHGWMQGNWQVKS